MNTATRKLKLQMQVSVDGFVAGLAGQLDWMTWNMDEQISAFINRLTDSCDTILLGRKMTDGFVQYWEQVPSNSPEYDFAQKMVSYQKIVFSNTLTQVAGKNIRVENGTLVEAVKKLKSQPGKDIIVYGGASFVAALIKYQLIDELNLFVNPSAIGAGMQIFSATTPLQLLDSKAYPCGIVVNTYQPKVA